MIKRIDSVLDQVQTHVLVFVLVAIIGMTFLAAWLYLFKAPMAEFQRLAVQVEKSRVDRDRQQRTDVGNLLNDARVEIDSLRSRLYGKREHVSSNEMIPYIIARLNGLAQGLRVNLLGVKPSQVQQVLMFDEVAFDVSVSGNYIDIVTWLKGVERELHPMVVKQFDMLNSNTPGELQIRLRIVSYRPREEIG